MKKFGFYILVFSLFTFFVLEFVRCGKNPEPPTVLQVENITPPAKDDWFSTGHINPCNCREFIVNDSLVIKSGQFKTLMTVYENGKPTDAELFQQMFSSDEELINRLEWHYKRYLEDKKASLDRQLEAKKNMENRVPGGFCKE